MILGVLLKLGADVKNSTLLQDCGESINSDKTPTEVVNFACNFLMKYHADAVLMEYNGSLFYYPLFK